jgi:hypothetical protein
VNEMLKDAYNLFSKLNLSVTEPPSLFKRPGKAAPSGNNPLASLQVPCPPTPRWADMRGAVLVRAEAFGREQERATQSALLERAQFTTAIALFIVIACCIVGLLLPGGLSGSGSLPPSEPGVGYSAGTPVLASFQHP